MIVLYQGSGAGGFDVLGPALSQDEWTTIRQTALRLLRTRGQERAVELLNSIPFEPFEGTNCFGDEFSLLLVRVPVEQYVEFEALKDNLVDKRAFLTIAQAIGEIGPFIRFIAVDVVREVLPSPVSAPRPKVTSQAVERALLDAEQLIRSSSGPLSAVDRAHTALHGYIKSICDEAGLPIPKDATITRIFKILRESHPRLSSSDVHSEHIERAVRGMATILDALSPLRNRGSVAHPNERLLGNAEAMLVINSARTILHYLDSKMR